MIKMTPVNIKFNIFNLNQGNSTQDIYDITGYCNSCLFLFEEIVW